MRTLVVGLALLVALAGCSDAPSKAPAKSADFEEFDVEPTATTGILLGVVVDEAIRPLADVKVGITLADGSANDKVTDGEGRFAFGDLPPGDYLVRASHFKYGPAQMTAKVVAGESNPEVNRIQLTRLFTQEPFMEILAYEGFLSCAYAIGVSSTCINDYTRVTGEQCLPTGECYCSGGCLRDYELAKQGGNIREYVAVIAPGWQSIIFEETWDPTSEAGQNLGFTVSYFSRPDAGHWFGSENGPNPLRMQLDVGVEHDSASYADDQPKIIPENGTEELFVFFGAGSGSVVLQQQFKAFQTTFYYAIPPEGWSFVNNDPRPF